MDINNDEQKRIDVTIAWIERMTKKLGATVYEKDRGMWWDWGQALCRECYGKEWNDLHLETPTWDNIQRALEWEKGKVPGWVNQKRMGCNT